MLNSLWTSATVIALVQDGVNSSQISGATIAMSILSLVAVALLVWGRSRLRITEAQLTETQSQLVTKASELKATQQEQRKLQQALTANKDKQSKLKRDLTNQRKKTHGAQEEIKALSKQQRVEIERIKKSPQAKPAVAAEPIIPQNPESVRAKETPPTAPTINTPAVEEIRGELEQERNKLTEALSKNEEECEKLRKALRKYKDEVRKLGAASKEANQRSERYRRIDLMTKKQTELLEDKLLTYGRRYYDSVSELALLKGEVKPPRPRDLLEAEEKAREKASQQEEVNESASETTPIEFDTNAPSVEDANADNSADTDSAPEMPTVDASTL